MGVITNIQNAVRNIVNKEPNFLITSTSDRANTQRIPDSKNYLDQYELITYKAIKLRADANKDYKPELHTIDRNGQSTGILTRYNNDLLYDLHWFNPFLGYDEARDIQIAHWIMTGSAYWMISDSEELNHKVEFYPLNPQNISYKPNSVTGLPDYYEYKDADGERHRIENNQIIVFHNPNPKDWLKGSSELDAGRYPHNTLEMAMQYNMNTFGNNGAPDGFMVFEGASQENLQRLSKQLKSEYAGARNAGKTGVLSTMFQYVRTADSPKDLAWKDAIEVLNKQLTMIYGVPVDLLGTGDTTYANAAEAQRYFQRYTIKPYLELEANMYNKQLLPKYYGRNMANLQFVAQDPVEADKLQQAEIASKLYQGGVITLDESRDMVDLAPAEEGGDEFFSNAPTVLRPELPQELTRSMKAVEDKVRELDKVVRAIPDVEESFENERDRLKGMFKAKAISSEDEFIVALNKYFRGQEKRLLDQTKSKKAATLVITLNLAEENKIAVEELGPVMQSVADEYNNIYNTLTGTYVDITDATRQEIDRYVGEFMGIVNENTQKKLGRILTGAVETGGGTSQATQGIQDLYSRFVDGGEGITETRAELIARTEVNYIANSVAEANYEDNEEVEGKQWLSAEDSAVRPTHAAADGQVVPKDGFFLVGGYRARFPGDPALPAAERVNCRCVTIPVLTTI